MTKRTLISAYGQPSDRVKLDRIASLAGKSSSAWLIQQIREAHAKTFGKDDDERILRTGP